MDLEKIEFQTKKMKSTAYLLIDEYQAIINSLNNILQITSLKNKELSQNINDMINKYHTNIKLLSEKYIVVCDKILDYLKSSNQNIDNFKSDLTNLLSIFTDNK